MFCPTVTGCALFIVLLDGGFGASVVTNATNGTFDIEHSNNQLDSVPTYPVLIVPGSALDHPGQTNITNRYTCGRYTFSFSMANPGKNSQTVTLTITISGSFNSHSPPICTVDWKDGSTDAIKVKTSSFPTNHTFATYGVFQVSGSCADPPNALVVCPVQNPACVTTASFFDDFFKKVATPLKYQTTDQVVLKIPVAWNHVPVILRDTQYITGTGTQAENTGGSLLSPLSPPDIKSLLRLDKACISNTAVIIWRLIRVINETNTEEISITQPETSVLTLGTEVLDPGEYIVFLEVSHPGVGPSYWFEDFLLVYITLPELVPFIDGGHLRFVPHGGIVYINATASVDPVTMLPSVTSLPLNVTWSLAHYASMPTKRNLEVFQRNFPISTAPPMSPAPVLHAIEQDTDNGTRLLEINTTFFLNGSWAFVMFSMARGERRSSTAQIIQFLANAVPVTISCVFNCNKGRERKFNYDRMDLDGILPDTLAYGSFSFSWTMHLWVEQHQNWTTHSISTNTGTTLRSIDILKSTWTEGSAYRIVLSVTNSNYASTDVELYGTVNVLPYGGTCTMSNVTGQAARTWFGFTCANWMGPDQRRIKSSSVDINPLLTFSAHQFTNGALVEEEPVLRTRSLASYLILKLGDPNNAYLTTIKVRATDIYNNYQEFDLNVTAIPAFAWDDVTPDEAGRAIITAYTNNDYVDDEQELVAMGKVDLLVPLVASVCSHIHLINLPEFAPPVPRQLNDAGAILDLKAGSNTEVGGLDELVEEAQIDYDLATLALMEVMQNMTNVIRNSSENFLVNSTTESDKFLGSILTNAFTNLAARKQYVNDATKKDMIYLSDLVGTRSLDFKENFTVDESAKIEVVSGEVYNMSQAIVNNVVPNDLTQFIHVNSLKNGRTQVNDMLEVVGQDIDIYNTSLSPAERAHLYITMQNLLQVDLNSKKETAKDAARMSLNLFKNVQDTLRICSTCTTYGNNFTDQLIVKNAASIVKDMQYSTNNATFRVDGIRDIIGNDSSSGEQTASVSAVEFTKNVFMYDDDQLSSSVTSNVLHIDVKLSTNRVTPTSMTFNQSVTAPETILYTPRVNDDDASEFSLHTYIYRYSIDYTCIIVEPENDTVISSYILYVRYRYVPTILEFDFITSVLKVNSWKVCIHPEHMRGNTGLVYVGIQVPKTVRHIKYFFTLVTLGCVTWEEGVNKWHSDKCDINWYNSENKLECSCRNLTDLTFGNTFFVAANTIDFSTVFLKFSPLNQAAVLGALGSILLLYVIALMIVIPLDKKDVLKWGITPLQDNSFGDNHYYIIKIYTGLRKDAGTKSRIAFILSGDTGDTGPRDLYDGLRKEYPTGSVRSFFMATKRSLGCLLHFYIWHDNSGEGNLASWYLSRVEVLDVTTKLIYTFVAEKWVAADTNLDLEIKATTSHQAVHFDSRFFYQARDRLSESHTWVSIMYRPQASTFTRVQRASCALVYIFLAMIANAMYFNPGDDYERVSTVEVGPFRFTLIQLYISIICAMITTPAIMLIVFLFKRSKAQAVSLDYATTMSDRRSVSCGCCKKSGRSESEIMEEEQLRSLLLSNGTPSFKSGFYLHHRCVYIAWFLVILGTVVPAFFIVLYSIEWGKQKSEEWLSTFLLSILESMLFVDPIMVIFLSMAMACIIRKPKSQSDIDIDQIVLKYQKSQGIGKEGLEYCTHVLRSVTTEYKKSKRASFTIDPPIKGKKLNEAANEFRHHKRMTSVLIDLVLNFLLVLVLATICYSNRDGRSYRHQEYIVNQMVDPNPNRSVTLLPRFNRILSHGDFFNWVNQTVFPSLFPEVDTTGRTLDWTLREYMSGFYNYRLGPPRIRQLRINSDICDIPRYGTVRCYGEYSIRSEHITDYCIGWTEKNGTCPTYMALHNVSLGAWSFTSALDIWGFPIPGHYATYGGGGYLATFDVNRNTSIDILNELFHKKWLDRQSRAVFFEFTIFCASTNIFIYSSFLVEFPETGGAITSYSIYPMRLYNHVGAVGIVTLVCEIIFVIFTLVLFVRLCVKFYQERCAFFRKFWLVYDAAMLVMAISAIAVFLVRLTFTYLTIEKFKKDKEEFVNFSHIVFWDQVMLSILAFLVFMATIRILEVFGEAKKVQAVIIIFKKCGSDLFSFGTMFIYLFAGFCLLGYLLFGSQLQSYMSFYRTMGTLFVTMLGVSKYAELNFSYPILAKIFFLMYTVCIVFFVLSFFLSILGETVDDVIKDTRREERQDIIEYVMDKVKSLVVSPNTGDRQRDSSNGRPKPNPQSSGNKFENDRVLPFTLSKGTTVGASLAQLSRD